MNLKERVPASLFVADAGMIAALCLPGSLSYVDPMPLITIRNIASLLAFPCTPVSGNFL
ncbi:hypothetical protein KR767_14615 [Luteibacter anthropi]|uniref:Uncharacterized protein n=1 Tax=Luteibacter anthropi TaxID=564369 RepID=A0A7X5ZJB0_9GAMM|nr:hypothetical protein [Luteibacter anthropi]NII07565.1 hypothetical protein [Luteibacter anthropi]URX61301.1 hypothetical protein KR767_14615 [Luteibacter anthropi]